uniref:Uncharacterized protein n=1 Tax=Helianthus annuus TaxID=4232 RepID=A0A251SP33_HELAN
MMLSMETRLLNPMRSKSNAAIFYNSVNSSVPLDSSANGDWQEEVYQQIKAMKDPTGKDMQEEVYQKGCHCYQRK